MTYRSKLKNLNLGKKKTNLCTSESNCWNAIIKRKYGNHTEKKTYYIKKIKNNISFGESRKNNKCQNINQRNLKEIIQKINKFKSHF